MIKRRKKNKEFNFSIFYDEYHVGGIGVRIDPFWTLIGEIGFFVDGKFWNRKIASLAL